jgi:hypothetical protein
VYSGNSSNSEFKNKDNSFFIKLIGSFYGFIGTKRIKLTFVATFKIPEMFEFSQYLGFFTFLNHSYNWVLVDVFLVGFVSWVVEQVGRHTKRRKEQKNKNNQFNLFC